MIHIGEFVICACVVLFAIQLVLCTYVKKLWIRLLPVELFSLSAVVLFFIALSAQDYALGYLLLALYAAFCALTCGLAWALWGIVRFWGRDKSERCKK